MSYGDETRPRAQRHMDKWDIDSADPGTISMVIGGAKAYINEYNDIMASYKRCGLDAPQDVYERIAFWTKYIEWGAPIVRHWWKDEART